MAERHLAPGRPALDLKLQTLPTKPGVYIMKDVTGKIIYVGKAINLRNRVRSYFHTPHAHEPKVQRLVAEIADLEYIIAGSELEALILECNLIKKHRPRYNVRLKDDKRYPYIKISMQEDYPRLTVTRRMLADGARYFGPFTNAKAVRTTLELVRHIFPYILCKREITGSDKRACLYYHIGRCPAPCTGAISREQYRELMAQIALFLEGRQGQILESLRKRMAAAAEALDFEQAAALRDQVAAVEAVIERQRVVSASLSDQDVIAFAREDGQACVQIFFVRGGKLIGRDYFVLSGTHDEADAEIMASFVKQFYAEAAYVPPEIVLPRRIDEWLVIEEWLHTKRGTKVTLRVPRSGPKRELVQMAAENATETLANLRAQWEREETRYSAALAELQLALGLSEPPARIECYDISNIQGVSATGSMVVFAKGLPRKGDYRHFRIKAVPGPDDFSMMREVLRRRFRRAQPASAGTKADSWSVLPSLVIVDGGLGQLNVAREVLAEAGLGHIAVAGLAKKEEELYLPSREEPLRLPRDSEALFLLQRIRDEAHRFAVRLHHKVHEAKSMASQLEEIPGIGPKRRKALLARFGSLDAIRAATVEELAAVPGMGMAAAKKLRELL
ncbi:MAG TPA: excinuclease ABC subunit UvrC [Anaerolineae bacterium]|nr:excinuclease ABC subunit UvrC [Anaerolineae bacterium]HPL27515.1 excinuclease ABC subunit UvrC [Anaerolineae bacterium]